LVVIRFKPDGQVLVPSGILVGRDEVPLSVTVEIPGCHRTEVRAHAEDTEDGKPERAIAVAQEHTHAAATGALVDHRAIGRAVAVEIRGLVHG
jgi:hypothetical protein